MQLLLFFKTVVRLTLIDVNIRGDDVCSVFDYMMKSNVINCQNSLYGMMSISGAQRAGLWSYYGNRSVIKRCSL